MIFNLKDKELNNYITWVYNELITLISALTGKITGYEDIGQLGAPKNITVAGENLDNYYTSGIYTFGANYTPVNVPTGNSNGWLVVLQWGVSAGTSKQFWLRHGTLGTNDFNIYVRTRIANVWGDWVEVITSKSQSAYQFNLPPVNIPSGSNLNDYLTIGNYYVSGTSVATTIENAPTVYNFKMTVEYITAAFIQQTVLDRMGKRWTRDYTISTKEWTNWVCGALDNIASVTMNNNGQLVVTRADGIIATFTPSSLT